jgi:hypothetical protein
LGWQIRKSIERLAERDLGEDVAAAVDHVAEQVKE